MSLAVLDLVDGDFRGARQNFLQHAFVGGIEVLHENESHAGVFREITKQFGEGFQAAGGSADADDRESGGFRRGGALSVRAIFRRPVCGGRSLWSSSLQNSLAQGQEWRTLLREAEGRACGTGSESILTRQWEGPSMIVANEVGRRMRLRAELCDRREWIGETPSERIEKTGEGEPVVPTVSGNSLRDPTANTVGIIGNIFVLSLCDFTQSSANFVHQTVLQVRRSVAERDFDRTHPVRPHLTDEVSAVMPTVDPWFWRCI